ncbi:MAG: DNA-3-methyladenine glycosylase I [Spirochaetota bacterium]
MNNNNNNKIIRCAWVPDNDELYKKYHDKEWGVPIHNDRKLFEFLVLDGMQAGLSWITILRKRENFRKAFDNFDASKIAEYNDDKINELLANKGIIRNKLKIRAVIDNAKAYLKIKKDFGSFDEYIWSFVNGKTIQNEWKSDDEVPAETEISKNMSKDMKKKGFKFVGPTICYAFMQAAGLVNDHITKCFRYEDIKNMSI